MQPHTDDIRCLVRIKGSNDFRPGYIKRNFGENKKANGFGSTTVNTCGVTVGS